MGLVDVGDKEVGVEVADVNDKEVGLVHID